MSTVCANGILPRSTTPLHIAVSLFILALIVPLAVPASAQSVPRSSHVILVIEENKSYNTVTSPTINGQSNPDYMPWLTGQGNTYGHATNYITNTSGSAMDYFWLSSGSCHSSADCSLPNGTHDFNCGGDGCFTPGGAVNPITDDSIFQELDNAGISWKVYAESLPSVGYTGGDSGPYLDRHNPAKWYNIVYNGTQTEKNKMVPFSQFSTDMNNNALPTYSIIIPNANDDAHDQNAGIADTWLQNNVASVLNQSYFGTNGDGLLIVTFDNGDGDVAGQVYTAVIGPKVTRGSAPGTEYQHQSTLSTLCAALGIGAGGVGTCPGAGGTASPMSEFFASGGGTSGVVINHPTTVPQLTSPVPFQATATSNGLPITAMNVYLDDNPAQIASFNGNGTATFTAQAAFNISTGTHTLNANAWDSGGNIYRSPHVTITVSSTGMSVGSPGNQSQITGQSPFLATVTSNGLPITAMQVYLDFNSNAISNFNGNGTSQLTASTTYTFTAGPHVLIVNAWDNSGAVYQSGVQLTVSNTGVNIIAPGNGSQITNGTPFDVKATSNGPAISAMDVYLDYNSTPIASYNGNGTNSLTETAVFSIANGSHTLIVNAWDNTGQIYQSAVNITVSSTGVTVASPTANSTVTSPVSFSATAVSNGPAIDSMLVYLDYNPTPLSSFQGNGTSTLTETASYTMAAGNHVLIVNAWDVNGQIYQTAVSFTVH